MFPRSFEYVAPASLDEAVAALKGAEFAKVMAGGMSLLPLMKLRLLSPDLVVDIGRIPGLDAISDSGDHVSIGALVRHHQTASSEA
ncbi:MAG: FAD binding domain-containing protein, partial [Acidimicrobiia bacterium]|nr:FAD binding domain-containing protein [Acidimicrobiia bacterium]